MFTARVKSLEAREEFVWAQHWQYGPIQDPLKLCERQETLTLSEAGFVPQAKALEGTCSCLFRQYAVNRVDCEVVCQMVFKVVSHRYHNSRCSWSRNASSLTTCQQMVTREVLVELDQSASVNGAS